MRKFFPVVLLQLLFVPFTFGQFEEMESENDFPDSLSNFERVINQSVFDQLNEWQALIADSTMTKIRMHMEKYGPLLHPNELIQVNTLSESEITQLKPLIIHVQSSIHNFPREIILLTRAKKGHTPGYSIFGKWGKEKHFVEVHGESDPGEKIGKQNNSLFLTYMHSGKWNWQVGDYQLRSPMGLIQYYSPRGFNGFGRLEARGIRFTPHRSWNEDLFLRGINFSRRIKKVTLWGYASMRERKLKNDFRETFSGWNNSDTVYADTQWLAMGTGCEWKGEKSGLAYGLLIDLLRSKKKQLSENVILLQIMSYHAQLGGVLLRGEGLWDNNTRQPQFAQEFHLLPLPGLQLSGIFRYLSREPENFLRTTYKSEPEFNSEISLNKTFKSKSLFTLLWIRSGGKNLGEWNYITQSIRHYWNRSTSALISLRRSESTYSVGSSTVRTSFTSSLKKEIRGTGSIEIRYDQVIRKSDSESTKNSNSLRIIIKKKTGQHQTKAQVMVANASDYHSRIILWDHQLFGYSAFRSFSEPGLHLAVQHSYRPKPYVTLYFSMNYSHSKATWILRDGSTERRSQSLDAILGIKFSHP